MKKRKDKMFTWKYSHCCYTKKRTSSAN